MNILFTSVGRRYYIIDYFKKNLDKKTKIISINSSIYSSAKNNSDFFYKSPEIQSEKYIKFVSSIIKKHKIKLVVPLIDIDCKKLSKNVFTINKLNAILIAPPYKIVNIITDKYKLYKILIKNKFYTPKTYISKNDFLSDLRKKKIKFPIILKPRYGTSSILTIKAKNVSELELFYKYLMKKVNYEYFNEKNHKEKIVIQEYIKGSEYGLDLLNSIGKNYHAHLLKEKIKMRNGETDICKISNKNISTMSKKISKLILHNFLVDIDMIEKNKKFYIIDINPRIGGGYPFTHTAGFNMINYLLKQIYSKRNQIRPPLIDSTSVFVKDIHISKINL